jgi:hypothetical protein
VHGEPLHGSGCGERDLESRVHPLTTQQQPAGSELEIASHNCLLGRAGLTRDTVEQLLVQPLAPGRRESTQGPGEESPTGARPKRSEDSGLIDLQALTAADPRSSGVGLGGAPGSGFGASPLISAPLGGVSGPAMGASLAPGYERRSGSRTGLMVAAAALAVAILGAAAFMVNRGAEDGGGLERTAAATPDSTASAAATAPSPVEPSPTPTEPEPAAEPEPEPEEPEPAAVAPKPAPVVKKAAPRPKPRTKPRPKPRAKPRPKPKAAAPTPTKTTTKPKPKKKKKKKAGCNCKPADLMCAMKCSAGK